MSALLARLGVILRDVQCPVCGEWYKPHDSESSHPHNNHPPDSGRRS